jgi:protein-S-isoprenylcysteine O-methyltransferase Ste14
MSLHACSNINEPCSPASCRQPSSFWSDGFYLLGSSLMISLMLFVAQATYLRLTLMVATDQALYGILDYLSEFASFCFACLIGILCMIRLKPVRQSNGLVPTLSALGGTFVLAVVNNVPLADLIPAVKSMAILLLATGNVLSIYCLAVLGRSFSILPQARKLVTCGPYAVIRHPLYMCEALAATGLIILHLSWISVTVGLILGGLQLRRVFFEEAVLGAAFPDYAAYAAQTPRFLPRLFWTNSG